MEGEAKDRRQNIEEDEPDIIMFKKEKEEMAAASTVGSVTSYSTAKADQNAAACSKEGGGLQEV
jgi:hypothetical protein